MSTYPDPQTIEIETKRTERKIIPVKLHHTPGWLAKRLRRSFGIRRDVPSGYLVHEATGTEDWLDHWGTAMHDGQKCFVSEPYLQKNSMSAIEKFAEIGGFTFENHGKRLSWWFPNETTRLVFRPMEDSH